MTLGISKRPVVALVLLKFEKGPGGRAFESFQPKPRTAAAFRSPTPEYDWGEAQPKLSHEHVTSAGGGGTLPYWADIPGRWHKLLVWNIKYG